MHVEGHICYEVIPDRPSCLDALVGRLRYVKDRFREAIDVFGTRRRNYEKFATVKCFQEEERACFRGLQAVRQFSSKLECKKKVAKYPSVFFEDPFAGLEDGQK